MGAATNPAAEPDGRDILRWYTRARRIPRLVGKLPGSERGIPGGPYTLTQTVGAIATGMVLLQTEPLWGRFGWLNDKVIVVVVTVATVLLLRFVKPGGRDPLTALAALLGVATASRHGRLRSRPIRAPRQVRVTARVRVLAADQASGHTSPEQPQAVPATASQQVPPSPAVAAATRELVAVDGLSSHEPHLESENTRSSQPSTRRTVRPIAALAADGPRTSLERLLLQAQGS